MKKILSLVIVFGLLCALTACGSSKDEDDVTGKTYNITYKGDTYILNEEGVLVKTLFDQAAATVAQTTDQTDPEVIDASLDAESQAKEERGGEDIEETDPVEDDDDIVEDKNFGDVSIISADDGFYLQSKDGKKLTTSYDILVDSYCGYTAISHQPEKFIAVDNSGIHILDTEGNVKKSAEIYNINYIKAYGNYFVYNVIGKNINTSCGVMDMNLKVLVEPTRYFEITPLFIYSQGEAAEDNGTLVAKYKDTYGGEVIDFIDKKGEILIDSALAFAYVDTDKVALLRGATIGFMNFNGEWLTKNPI